jgi:hypothetical protein
MSKIWCRSTDEGCSLVLLGPGTLVDLNTLTSVKSKRLGVGRIFP